jgi:hypothetical protein
MSLAFKLLLPKRVTSILLNVQVQFERDLAAVYKRLLHAGSVVQTCILPAYYEVRVRFLGLVLTVLLDRPFAEWNSAGQWCRDV